MPALVFLNTAASGLTTYELSDPLEPLGAEVMPAALFPTETDNTRLNILRDLNLQTAEQQQLLADFLQNPHRDELFFKLARPNDANRQLEAYALAFSTAEEINILRPLLEYRHLLQARGIRLNFEQEPSEEFVLHLRDILQTEQSPGARRKAILLWLMQDNTLSRDELHLLDLALEHFCEGKGRTVAASAAMRRHLRDFAGGKPIIIEEQRARDLALRNSDYMRLLHAEYALRGKVCPYLPENVNRSAALLLNMVWRDAPTAVILARTIANPGFELLELSPETLPRHLMFKGVRHYSEIGHDTPECCLSALNLHRQPSLQAAQRTVRSQTDSLPPALQALAPRCMLAVQGGADSWQAVTVTAQGVSPLWPDVSAVQLPQWQPSLLNLQDEQLDTLLSAFRTDAEQLADLFGKLRTVGAVGQLLAAELALCERVRPKQHDLTIPVYMRIAMHAEADGVVVDFTGDDVSISPQDAAASAVPIINEAVCKVPQLMHRLALLLAVLEKNGHTAELEQACAQLARLLNTNKLWSLVICQRELRGFSPRALISLFTHYEGEAAPLFDYGEAMGMREEMRIAALGHEDELGLNLHRAACVSGIIPATPEERQEAVQALLATAKAHAMQESPLLTGCILGLLTHHGAVQAVADWEDCPAHCLSGEYSTAGLHLIRLHLQQGHKEPAQQVLQAMTANHTDDTTPAAREAMALLADSKEQAARLHRDALLLAMWYRRVNAAVYHDYLADQVRYGTQYLNVMKSELVHSWGRSAGISEEMARRFAREGMWEAACFAYEYLLAEGLTCATPYGAVADHAHLHYYRAYADICRSKMSGNPRLAELAMQRLQGTPAYAYALQLAQHPPVQNDGNQP